MGILIMTLLLSQAYLRFCSLDVESKVENLRWLSSALIQSLAAILAIVPAVGLAFLSFFGSRYPSRIRKHLWMYVEWSAFFIVITFSIAMCSSVLMSVPEASLDETSRLNRLMFVDIAAIIFAFVAIGIILRKISTSTDIEKVFERAKDEIIKEGSLDISLEEVEKQEKRHIIRRRDISLEMLHAIDLSLSKTDDPFEDYFSLMVSLAEGRDLTGLKIGIAKLFDLMLAHEKFYKKVIYTLGEILLIYRDRQILPYSVLRNMIHKQYLRISRSENPTLIRNILVSRDIVPEDIRVDTVPRELIVEDFYRYRVQEEGYTLNMNPEETIKLAKKIVDFQMKKEMMRFWTEYAANMTNFMINAWEQKIEQGGESIMIIETIKKMLERTEREEAQKVGEAIESLAINLKRFQANLEHKYQGEYKVRFLDWLEEENEKRVGITPPGNIINALYIELHGSI